MLFNYSKSVVFSSQLSERVPPELINGKMVFFGNFGKFLWAATSYAEREVVLWNTFGKNDKWKSYVCVV